MSSRCGGTSRPFPARHIPGPNSAACSASCTRSLIRPLGRFTDPFYSVASAINEAPAAMAEPDRVWLQQRITSLRDEWGALALARSPGLIHGDAHVGNLIQAACGDVLLGDWDHVAMGPREWDLMQIHYWPLTCAPTATRTRDLLLRRQSLYPLSYRGLPGP